MDKTNLVYIKGGIPIQLESGTTFDPNKLYRSIQVEDGSWLVYGESFNEDEFFGMFQFAHERIMYHLNGWMLNDGDKAISKRQFTNMVDIQQYGKGKNRLFILVFRNSLDILYGFYPTTDTKPTMINECYRWYCDIVNGDMSSLDDGDVQNGNRGIPISYGDLRNW